MGTGVVQAADTVKIGILWPLTGNAAAAGQASKAAAGKATDRPRTAAGKAKVAVTRASRESAAARRRAKTEEGDES